MEISRDTPVSCVTIETPGVPDELRDVLVASAHAAASMPDINLLLRSLNEDRLRRRGATEAEPVPDVTESPSESSPACYKTVPLLALDLDGTLLDTTVPGMRPGVPSFTVDTVDGMYETRLRPGLSAFLSAVRPHFQLAIFTAGNAAYAERMVDGIDAEVPGFRASLRCVFSRERVDCTYEPSLSRWRITKDLRSLARHCGLPLCRCLIVDDTPETYRLNPSNALPVPVYTGSSSDRALECLRSFLLAMPRKGVPLDVRAWPLGPRGAQPLLAALDEDARDGGCVLGRASTACGRDHPCPADVAPAFAPAFVPAFLPPPEEDEDEMIL